MQCYHVLDIRFLMSNGSKKTVSAYRGCTNTLINGTIKAEQNTAPSSSMRKKMCCYAFG